MNSKQPKPTMSDVLKAAIAESKLPLLTLEVQTGVQRASIARFIRGETSLRLDLADKLATYFELTLVPSQRSTSKGK